MRGVAMPCDPFESLPGGFSPTDGTVDFYLRVRCFLSPESRVLDLGAGRGAWYEGRLSDVRRKLRHLAPDVCEVVAADVDVAVRENQSATRTVLIEHGRVPVPDHYFDVVIADYVLEHVADCDGFVAEVSRVLKPGGLFCARTPHAGHYVAIASRLLGKAGQLPILARVQPTREAKDAFPTVYRLNTLASIHRAFHGWESRSFVFSGDPGYYWGNRLLFGAFRFVHWITPAWFHGNIFVFVWKPAGDVAE